MQAAVLDFPALLPGKFPALDIWKYPENSTLLRGRRSVHAEHGKVTAMLYNSRVLNWFDLRSYNLPSHLRV